MREIKFRGKCNVPGEWLNKWIYGFGVHVSEGDEITAELYTTEGIYEVDPETVGQYTGLKDREGKEIYEGDTVRFDILMNRGSVEEHVWTFENRVEFENGCYFVSDWLLHNITCEVLGSIHDHPHLLEG